jgi:hypothetical protein
VEENRERGYSVLRTHSITDIGLDQRSFPCSHHDGDGMLFCLECDPALVHASVYNPTRFKNFHF